MLAKAVISAKSLKEMIRWKDRDIEPEGGWDVMIVMCGRWWPVEGHDCQCFHENSRSQKLPVSTQIRSSFSWNFLELFQRR